MTITMDKVEIDRLLRHLRGLGIPHWTGPGLCQKSGFMFYMGKEIIDRPDALVRTLRGRSDPE